MEYMAPDYYREFHCIADACEDTCCAGWQIAVDQKSLKKYKKVRGAYRHTLWSSINWFSSTFKQSKDLRCAFLKNDNLCDMYQNLGAASLCKTCHLYPRHVEEFEGVREITLSISCPEVARLLMNRMTPVTFLHAERDGEEEYEDFDPFLYSQLVDARDVMIQILQNRELSILVRTKLIYGIAHDMQIRINQQNLFSCFDAALKYQSAEAIDFVKKDLASRSSTDQFNLAQRAFHVLNQMELLRHDWQYVLDEAQMRLYQDKAAEDWLKISKEFHLWMKALEFPWDIQKEQLLVYFISTYFCGAVYDGQVLAKTNIALTSIIILEELLKSIWLRNERCLEISDVVELVYRYSREIEHSDDNLAKLSSKCPII